VQFIELPKFTELITDLVDDRLYADFQNELCRNPHKGAVIVHSGGLRKARMRLPGRGKSGGARIIYLHLEDHETIVLFYVYTKARSDDLTNDELKRLRTAAAMIKQEFRK
jgi:hypothetical protein